MNLTNGNMCVIARANARSIRIIYWFCFINFLPYCLPILYLITIPKMINEIHSIFEIVQGFFAIFLFSFIIERFFWVIGVRSYPKEILIDKENVILSYVFRFQRKKINIAKINIKVKNEIFVFKNYLLRVGFLYTVRLNSKIYDFDESSLIKLMDRKV
ncbi:MAG: hypothetical protein JNL74_09975 [Fibrobacteres bacterium]|nr:hypothetical protein [Fibrobacterota bacterium]